MAEDLAAAAVGAVITNVDAEVREYLGSILAGDLPADADGVYELIGEMLLGYEVCLLSLGVGFFGTRGMVTGSAQAASDESEAAAKCALIYEGLVACGLCGAGAPVKKSDEPQLLAQPLVIAEVKKGIGWPGGVA